MIWMKTTLEKAFVGGALLLSFGVSSAFATATANFTPTTATSVAAGTFIDVDISINKSVLSTFDFAFILIGTTDPIAGLSFSYDTAWDNAFDFTDMQVDSGEHLPYAHDVLLSSDNIGFGGISSPSLSLGSVTIDTSSMVPGTYGIGISNAVDGESVLRLDGEGPGVEEPIEGSMTFTIVPEPATLVFFLIGGVSLMYRTRTQGV